MLFLVLLLWGTRVLSPRISLSANRVLTHCSPAFPLQAECKPALYPWALLGPHLERRGQAGCESGSRPSDESFNRSVSQCPHPRKGGLAISRLLTGNGGDSTCSTCLSSSGRLAQLVVITRSPRQQERASFNVQTMFEAQLYHVCCGPLAKERLMVELSICVTGGSQCCGYREGKNWGLFLQLC